MSKWVALLVVAATIFSFVFTATAAAEKSRSLPELTSTALKVHKIYTRQPPHDRQLYDILQVPSNATQAQIAKSYRSLSRKYHPDKIQKTPTEHRDDNDDDVRRLRLQQLQRAYQILKDDSTRVFYHKYGLTDPNLAVLLLLGPKLHPTLLQQQQQMLQDGADDAEASSSSSLLLFETLDPSLMRLIGYDAGMLSSRQQQQRQQQQDGTNTNVDDMVLPSLEDRRVQNIAALLVEQMRPIVEGTLNDNTVYAHVIAQQCDRWKRLPLGAQIIRCVGRAYRHVGQDFLQQHQHAAHLLVQDDGSDKLKLLPFRQMTTGAAVGMRKRWHSAKHVLEAGAVGCKLVLLEQFWRDKTPSQQQTPKQQVDAIEYHEEDDEHIFLPFGINDDISQSLDELEQEQKREEKHAAQQTLIQALQVEALWKACKIDIDRVVRKACERILSGDYYFFPSHTTAADPAFVVNGRISGGGGGDINDSGSSSHGWVGTSSGNTIDAERARVTAAQTMVMVGDILVQQSKQHTSWKD